MRAFCQFKTKMNFRSNFVVAAAACLIAHAAVSCDDSSNIGASIAEDELEIVIDSTFTITGRTVANGAVQSRTLTQLLGRIDAEGYGRLSSEVVTQFMPSAALDTQGISVKTIDSLSLVFNIVDGNYVGDSIAPLGIEVYRLNRRLPSPIYSDFDPTGYYDPSKCIGRAVYNMSNIGVTDTLPYAAARSIRVSLPQELAQELYRAYIRNPKIYSSPNDFINQVFQGLYIRNSFGSGRLTNVSQTIMQMFYHTRYVTDMGRDTTINYVGNYFAVTPEIVTNNNIKYQISPDIQAAIDRGENIVVAPAGYNVEFTFPGREIVNSYNSKKGQLSVVNTLSLILPADTLKSKLGISAPPYMLLIKKSKMKEFFSNNQLPDNVNSFYANYDSTHGRYYFAGMREYILDLLSKDEIKDEDVDFVLTPVNVTTESNNDYYYGSTSTVTEVAPYVSGPAMAKILFDKAKIRFVYSNQSINN